MPRFTAEYQRPADTAIKAIGDALISAVEVGGSEGVAGGTLYAAMMQHGCSLEVFEVFMGALVNAGRVYRRGDFYYISRP